MEPITQGLLGAATGYAVAGRRLGRVSLLWGALIGMTPDLDVILGPLDGGFGEWIYHRGTTHSIWFGFVAGPVIGWALARWRDPDRKTPTSAWIALAIVALVTHPLLDGFTPYGTQLLAPFSRMRFVWNGVAIVDPFYSVLLAIGVAVAARAHAFERARTAVLVALACSSLYLAVGLVANRVVLEDLGRVFASRRIPVDRARAYPTIFQPWLRHFVVHSGNDRLVGFHSLFAMGCPVWKTHPLLTTAFSSAPSGPSTRLDTVLETWQGQTFAWFSDGDFGVEERRVPSGILFRMHDLRYAWSSADAIGMWGIEAHFDLNGRLQGEPRRFSRTRPTQRDIDHLQAALLGRLPRFDEGWQRFALCESSPTGETRKSS